jgi:hypothetical protein
MSGDDRVTCQWRDAQDASTEHGTVGSQKPEVETSGRPEVTNYAATRFGW